jgi:hypothetical protein
MAAKEEYNSEPERKTTKKANTCRISLMLLALALPTVARADTVQRFVYRDIADTATLSKGGQELDYRFWLEDWDIDGWTIKVIRNELIYRYGLTDRSEIGISPMHSSALYWYKGCYWWGTISGFNELLLYGKHQLLKEPDSAVTVSIGGMAFAPTGSTKGFSAREWWTSEFVALSKEIGSWRIAGNVGWSDYGNNPWKDGYYWGAGAIQKDGGLNLEIAGSDHSLQGLIGVAGPIGTNSAAKAGLMIPMDGSDMDWRFIFGLAFFF